MLYLDRAITYNNWLTWADALPEDHSLHDQLTTGIAACVTTLAGAIGRLHELLPDYRRLTETPFTVSQWWDPTDDLPYSAGAACIFRLGDYRSWELLEVLPKNSVMSLEAVTNRYVKASLPGYHPTETTSSHTDRSPRP